MNAPPKRLEESPSPAPPGDAAPALPTVHSGNLWRCADCKCIRTCQWDHLADLTWLIGFTACSCGDACIPNSEVGAANPFLALAIARHLWP
jgi:hypothetical protein